MSARPRRMRTLGLLAPSLLLALFVAGEAAAQETGAREGEAGRGLRVLMLGWEFPPYFAGGVGVVCSALTRALANRGIDITYVMPFGPSDVRGTGSSATIPDLPAIAKMYPGSYGIRG